MAGVLVIETKDYFKIKLQSHFMHRNLWISFMSVYVLENIWLSGSFLLGLYMVLINVINLLLTCLVFF